MVKFVDHWCNLTYASKQGKRHYYACDTKYHKWFIVLTSPTKKYVLVTPIKNFKKKKKKRF